MFWYSFVVVSTNAATQSFLQTEPSSELFVVVQPEDPPDDSPNEEETYEESQEPIQPDQVNYYHWAFHVYFKYNRLPVLMGH